MKVKKKDGTEEPLQLSKVESLVKKAGGSAALAGETAIEVAVWVKEEGKRDVISMIDLQRKIISFVAKKNAQVANKAKEIIKKA